jgi:hypothetical protein
MKSSLPLLLLALLPSTLGCKKQDDKDKPAPASPAEYRAQPPKSAEPAKETPSPIPPSAATPLTATPLSEKPLIIYSSDTQEMVAGSWEIEGVKITLRPEAVKLDDKELGPILNARVVALIGDVEQEVYICKALDPAAGGYIDLMLRDDKLHIRCVNPPHSQDVGTTTAGRFGFDSNKEKLVASGSYSGDGIVDPDSLDLDEDDVAP